MPELIGPSLPASTVTKAVPQTVPATPEETTAKTAAAPSIARSWRIPLVLRRVRKAGFRPSAFGMTSIAAISFSLTFVAGSVALLTGVMPPAVAGVNAPVDLGVLLLMVPLCALVLTILAEVFRAAISGLPRVAPPRLTPALSDWRPGRGEG